MNSKALLTRAGLAISVILSLGLTGCGKKSSGPVAAPRSPFVERKVTPQTFISGREFCARYNNIKGPEYGRYVPVPKDYSNPGAGSLQIWVYSKRQFNPSLETFVMLDGGPGQNTHGSLPMLRGEVNELQFDQRGLGCSTPNSWTEYSNWKMYSTENTIRDLEEIRKNYGVAKISVYGISYGTVPATMYASKFPNSVKSVVIEGVVGTFDQLHNPRWKAEKLNAVLAQITSAQKSAFSDLLLRSRGDNSKALMAILMSRFYSDDGTSEMIKILNNAFSANGTVNQKYFDFVISKLYEMENRYSTDQQPMGVDLNILTTIYCRELGVRQKTEELDYDHYRGFFASSLDADERAEASHECNKAGVPSSEERPYQIQSNKVSAPVYYFQGTHDGATLAAGAFEHWKVVPQGQTYFMLAVKGGHNPNLTRLGEPDEEEPTPTRAQQQDLMLKAVLAQPLDTNDVMRVNSASSASQGWKMYLGSYSSDVLNYLGGI